MKEILFRLLIKVVTRIADANHRTTIYVFCISCVIERLDLNRSMISEDVVATQMDENTYRRQLST